MIFCAVLALAATFSSCNKNNMGEKVAGTYSGYSVANSQYFSDRVTENEKLIITNKGDNVAEIIFNSADWGNFSIKEGIVKKVGNSYEINGNGTCEMGMGEGPAQTYECTVEAVVNSLQSAIITFTIPSVMGGLTVEFRTGVPQN